MNLLKLCGLVFGSLASVCTGFASSSERMGFSYTYQWNFESDSGFADINNCERKEFNAEGVLVSKTKVHKWVKNRSEKNVFCAGLEKNKRSDIVFRIEEVENAGEIACVKYTNEFFAEPVESKFCNF
jgi:hypothetical protein